MKKFFTLSFLVILTVLLFFTWNCKKALVFGEWNPKKPISMIVPWGAGGSTDRVARVLAGELETPLGQKIVVINQPGASGSLGTKNCMEAQKDGYTWTAGAAKDLGNYKVKGFLDTTIKDWNLFLGLWMPCVVSVNADSKYKTFDDLLKAFKDNPGKIKVATAGVNSAGDTAIETIKKYTNIQYKLLAYDGGNPAVIATVSKEADCTTQLSVEEVDMIRAGKLRALAVLGSEPLEIKNVGTIPSITKWIPEFKAFPIYFGIFIPKGVPDNVIKRIGKIWDKEILNSQVIKNFASENGMYFDPCWGDEAQKKAFPMIQLDAWQTFDAGKAKVNPETIGIPRPKQ